MKSTATASNTKQGTPPRFDTFQTVTDIILGHLERGVVPWRQPWNSKVGRPRNLASGHPYQGVNIILLALQRFDSPYWLTIRQANDLGGQVRKGERGTLIVKYGSHEKRIKGKEEEAKKTFYLKGYTVFNALQIDGIEPPQSEGQDLTPRPPIEAAEEILAGMPSKPAITEGRKVKACYQVESDTIEMPTRSRFETAERYYAVLFHEIIHSTGHESRLNRRSLMSGNGSVMNEYSKEELVAEMGAAFLEMEAGIVDDGHEQSAAYLESWLATLRESGNKRWIIEAASQAGKAANYVLVRD